MTLIQGHVLDALKTIPRNSVDCIITSPPYWGLRKYPDSANIVWGGDENCEHEWEISTRRNPLDRGGKGQFDEYRHFGALMGVKRTTEPVREGFCKKCFAWYGQLGLEPTLEMYIEHLLEITKELKRVLKPTGVMFWNHGDCWGGVGHFDFTSSNPEWMKKIGKKYWKNNKDFRLNKGIPQKCMALQNYRLVLRMIDEQGWILRNIIIWYKPNHMPESVKDRFTKAYEPIFMLVKKKKYWFDLDAVREPHKESTIERSKYGRNPIAPKFWRQIKANVIKLECNPLGKNPGDVWEIPTQPFPESHFAVFPEKLVERCIEAGCPKEGIVLDPFLGSGTTMAVARKLRRSCIGIEIVPEYIEMAKRRVKWGESLPNTIEWEFKVIGNE